MTAITWRTLNGGSPVEALGALNAAENSFSNAFGGVRDSLKQFQATEDANWQQTKLNNTNSYMDQLRSIDTPEKFAEAKASGLLDQLKQGYGAQVDAQAVGAAQDARMGILQDRAIKAGLYQDQQTDRTQRPVVDDIRMLYAKGDIAGGDALLAQHNELRNRAELVQTGVTSGREAKRFGWDGDNQGFRAAEAGRAAEMGPLQLQQAREQILNARDSRLTNAQQREASAYTIEAAKAARDASLRQATLDKDKARGAEALKGTLYESGVWDAKDIVGNATLMKTLDVGDGNPTKQRKVMEALVKLQSAGGLEITTGTGKDAKKERVPLSKDMVLKALSGAQDKFLSWNGGYADSVIDSLNEQAKATINLKGADGNFYAGNKMLAEYQAYESVRNGNFPKPASAAVNAGGASGGWDAASKLDAALANKEKKKTVNNESLVPAHPTGSGEALNRAAPTPKGTSVTSTEGFSLSNPSVPTKPLDTSKVVWGKAEQVVDAGVESRKGKAMVLTVGPVTDGDTVNLLRTGGQPALVCRLDGIDARETPKSWKNPPDPGQAYGKEAGNVLARLIENKEVSVTVTKAKDKYSRAICQIDVQGKNVSAELVKAGAAYLTERFYKDGPETSQRSQEREAYRVFQQDADRRNVGMFGLPNEANELSPYAHRKAQEKLQEAYKSRQR